MNLFEYLLRETFYKEKCVDADETNESLENDITEILTNYYKDKNRKDKICDRCKTISQ